MDFDYQLFKDIVLVAIPTVAGALTSKWLTNSWQTRKEKNEIKRKILTEFENSVGKTYSLINDFVHRIYETYCDYNSVKIKSDVEYEFSMLFPSTPDQMPFQKFQSEYNQFSRDYWSLSYEINQLLRSIRLYYMDDDLEEIFVNIIGKFGIAHVRFNQFIRAENAKDLIDRKKILQKELDEIDKRSKDFEMKIIKGKLKI